MAASALLTANAATKSVSRGRQGNSIKNGAQSAERRRSAATAAMENVDCCAHGSLFMISHISKRPAPTAIVGRCKRKKKLVNVCVLCFYVTHTHTFTCRSHSFLHEFVLLQRFPFLRSSDSAAAAPRQTFSAASFVNLHFYGFNMFT